MGDGTRSTLKLTGKYFATPSEIPEGVPAYILLDNKGRIVNLVQAVDDHGNVVSLLSDHGGNLHTVGPHGVKSAMVNEPGLAYANGVNALCIAAPSDEDHHLEILSVYLSTNAAGSFYLVTRDLGVAPGATSAYTFDLVGVMGDDLVDTCDVAYAAFLSNQGRGVTGGGYQMNLLDGAELYLIAPNVTYHIHVTYLEESA